MKMNKQTKNHDGTVTKEDEDAFTRVNICINY